MLGASPSSGMAVVSMSDMRFSGSLGLVVRLSLVAHIEEEAPLVAERGELVLVELRLQNDGGVVGVVAADVLGPLEAELRLHEGPEAPTRRR